MVLRPVYHSQAGGQNMQYPYQEACQPEQGSWQTPYGTQLQAAVPNDHSAQSQRSSPPAAHSQYVPPGPYATATGESSNYYNNSEQRPTYDSSWSNRTEGDHRQSQYNDAPLHQPPYHVPQGPYGYEHPGANPYGLSFQPPSHGAPSEVKQEGVNAYGQQAEPCQNSAHYGPTEVKQDEAISSSGSASQPQEDRGIMGALAGAAAGGYAGT